MKIIAISGKAQHGKDTTAEILKRILENDGHRVLVTHYADLLKYICQNFFGWDGNKDASGRDLLQKVGTDNIRNKDNDFWVNFIVAILKFFPDSWEYVLIPDCRFPNEIESLRSAGFDVIHLRVVRPHFNNSLTPEQRSHPSETALDDTDPNYTIINGWTKTDLEESARKFVYHILRL